MPLKPLLLLLHHLSKYDFKFICLGHTADYSWQFLLKYTADTFIYCFFKAISQV